MTDAFVLYGSCESGHSYKVRLLLELARVPYRYQEIDLRVPRAQRPEPFRSYAKFGEVPLLVHNGRPYAQSNSILLHLAAHLRAWGGETPERLARAREWLFWEANRLGLSTSHLRYGRKFEPELYEGSVLPWFRARFDDDVARLEEELADGRAYLLGEAPSVADIALCAYQYWPEHAQIAHPPQVQAWLDRIAALPGWRHPYRMEGAQPF